MCICPLRSAEAAAGPLADDGHEGRNLLQEYDASSSAGVFSVLRMLEFKIRVHVNLSQRLLKYRQF